MHLSRHAVCHAQAWRCILYTYFVNAFRSTEIHNSQQQISKVDEPKKQKAWRSMRRNICYRDWAPRRSQENTALLYQNVQRSSSTLGYLNMFKYNWNRPRETNGNKNSERSMRRNICSRDWASRKSKENRTLLNLIPCLFSTYSQSGT